MTIIVSSARISPAIVYDELLTGIYTLTARPDLVAETALAIRRATMRYHSADLWKNDISIVIPNLITISQDSNNIFPSFRYQLDLTDAITYPLYRKVQFIRGISFNVDPLTGMTISDQPIDYKELDADRILDDYKIESINYWYQAGQVVNLRCSGNIQNATMGYWQFPNIVPATYNSWIAQQFPDMIITEATAYIYRIIGKTAEAQVLAQEFPENLWMLQQTQIAY